MINLSLASSDSNPKEVAPQQPIAPVVSGYGYGFSVARLLNPYRYLHLPSFNPYNYFPSSYLPTSAPQLPMQKLDGKELDIATSWQLVDNSQDEGDKSEDKEVDIATSWQLVDNSQDEGDKSEDKEVDISISRPLAVDSTDEFATLMSSWELLGDDKGGGEKVDDKVNSSKPSLEVDAEALDKESIKLLPTPVERAKEAFAKLGEENFPGMQPDELARRRLQGERALALLFHKAQANQIKREPGWNTINFPAEPSFDNFASHSPFFGSFTNPFFGRSANPSFGNRKISAVVSDDKAFGITRHRFGQGAVKTVKAAFDLADGSLVARATGPRKDKKNTFGNDCRLKRLDNEIKMLELFKGEKEFIQIIHSYTYEKIGFVNKEKRSIIMECAELDLEHFLKSKKKADFQQSIVLFHDILLGIVKMQDKNIIHRDIKPANILLKATENGFQAKIADFDAALESSEEDGTSGTPLYWSPEILLNQGKKVSAAQPINPFLGQQKGLQERIEKLERLIKIGNENLKKIEGFRTQINEGKPIYTKGGKTLSFTLDDLASKEAYFRGIIEKHEGNITKCKKELTELAGELVKLQESNSIVAMKRDVWAYGVMLYELLYGESFLADACKPLAPSQVVNFDTLPAIAIELKRGLNFVDGLLAQGFNSDVQQKMNNVLKRALIVDADLRPDARGLYAVYCQEFNLDPQV